MASLHAGFAPICINRLWPNAFLRRGGIQKKIQSRNTTCGQRGRGLRQIGHQFFDSAPGVFLVGSGVSGFEAPVFFLGSGTGTTTSGGGAYASFGVTTDGVSGGAEGSTGVCANTGVAAKSNVANVKAVAVCFMRKTSLETANKKPRHCADRGSRQPARRCREGASPSWLLAIRPTISRSGCSKRESPARCTPGFRSLQAHGRAREGWD
jgi:hypothetical protein